MKLTILVILLFLVSCASKKPKTDRKVAALESTQQRLVPGTIDYSKSSVRLFPPVLDGGYYRYYFYVDLKDEAALHTDCDPEDIELKNEKGKAIQFRLERILTGRYYAIIEASEKLQLNTLHFYLKGKMLKGNFKITSQKPVQENSSIRLIKDSDYNAKLVLNLRDANGRPVTLTDAPELILNGDGQIYGLTQVKEGVWEFSIHYSEQNHIMYISVRAQGVYFRNLFRFHHVEKYP